MPAIFDAAIAWKLQNLRELRRSVIDEFYEAVRNPELAATIVARAREVAERVPKYDKELREFADLTSSNPGKAWDIAKQNLEKQIETDQANLAVLTDGDSIRQMKVEISALQSFLAALVAEGQP